MDLSRTSFKIQVLISIIFGTLQVLHTDGQEANGFPSFEQIQMAPVQFAAKSEKDESSLCKTPQYFELGRKAYFDCSFPQEYFGIFWYSASELLDLDPIPLIYMKNYTKNGHGYESEEYDMTQNGSLIINTVSLQHDQNFTALIFTSSLDEYSPNHVRVIVTVRPYQTQPHIQGCEADQRVCFKKMDLPFQLTCSVVDARPTVQLAWFEKTLSGDIPLQFTTNITLTNSLYTTRATVPGIQNNKKEVTVYLCRSISKPTLLMNDESIVVVQRVLESFIKVTPVLKLLKHSAALELSCTDQPVLYLVWKRQTANTQLHNVAQVLFTNETSFQRQYSNRYHLETSNRSFIINDILVEDEGVYFCTFGNGSSEEVIAFRVQVYIIPNPPYPIVDGCSHYLHCALYVTREGTASCSLKGTRPSMELEWEVVHASQKSLIKFSDHNYIVKKRGFAYDVSLVSDFYVDKKARTTIAVLCKTRENANFPLQLSVKIYIVPLNGQTNGDSTTKEYANQIPHVEETLTTEHQTLPYGAVIRVAVICATAIVTLVAILLFCYCVAVKLSGKHRKTEANIPLNDISKGGHISKIESPHPSNTSTPESKNDSGIDKDSKRTDSSAECSSPLLKSS